jgi:hypothetical protein
VVADDGYNEDKENYNAVMPTTVSGKNFVTFLVLKCIFIESVTKIKMKKLVSPRICDYGCDHQHDHHQLVVKVKSSRCRPGVAQRVSGGLGSQIFMTFGT